MGRYLSSSLVFLLIACAAVPEQERVDNYVALLEAVRQSDETRVQLLLERGTPVDALYELEENEIGSLWAPYTEWASPINLAVDAGDVETLRLLLRYKPVIDKRCCDSLTPLGDAAAAGNAVIVQMLLEAGADPHVSSLTGTTPLDAATKNGHKDVARILEAAMKDGK